MIKKVIAAILQNYHNALEVGTELIETMKTRRETFHARLKPLFVQMIDDYIQQDKGLTVEVSNHGYMVYHKNNFLFRASLVDLSERVEVMIDYERVIVYHGQHEVTDEEFERGRVVIQSSLISAFKKRLREQLAKELARL